MPKLETSSLNEDERALVIDALRAYHQELCDSRDAQLKLFFLGIDVDHIVEVKRAEAMTLWQRLEAEAGDP